MTELVYWLALNSLPDIGPVNARRLVAAFGSPERVFQMPQDELQNVEGIGESRSRSIAGFDQWDTVRRELETADKKGIKLMTLQDKEYPAGLRNIHDAPLVLYIRGDLMEADKYAIAMVGSRASTDYGMQTAEKMGHRFASSGLTVVSGMARGIDSAAHKGALKAGGRTVAVLGSGIDVPYPASNRGLMKSIEESGAVISEFPMGTAPGKENFPRRNRIISALSFGVVVVEAARNSGSLITAAYALDQGREVFAVPGNITSVNSGGTNDLIRKGARLVESAEEVIEELRPQLRGVLREHAVPEKNLPLMTDDESTLYHYLGSGPKHIDMITREKSIPAGKALSILLNLELKGVIRQTEGKHFSLN
ncbi:MAG: DNA-protecting protein DprA [Nitrospiraceae bacterium]|nr:MAG: DNA-protecting protein DprA [Nitrospiraceae bacterium]